MLDCLSGALSSILGRGIKKKMNRIKQHSGGKNMKVKNEKLFVRFYEPGCMTDGPEEWEPSDKGRQQFIDHQSLGNEPEDPDPYYKVLRDGKKSFDFLCSEYKKMYTENNGTGWWGLYTLWLDWEGERWLLPHLLKWWKKETGRDLPHWIGQESSWESPDLVGDIMEKLTDKTP
jgi:hypothetical protein